MDTPNENVKANDVNDNTHKVKQESLEVPLTQLELIKQWRTTLACLMKDVKFDRMRLAENDKSSAVLEGIEYLDKTNALLDDNESFQLSETGLSTYKSKHMQVFDFLSNLPKHAILRTNYEFYFVDIAKHLEQQLIPCKWKHTFMYLLLIPFICAVFVVIGVLMIKQTQSNIVVYILFFLCVTSQFSVIPALFKKVKKNVASPFKFKVSLLAIYLLNSLRKMFWICLIPIFLVKKIQPYWIDDVIIISLVIYYFVLCVADQFIEAEILNDTSNKEVGNV